MHIFNTLEGTELEKIESIDMLRLLENKYKVKMILSNTQVFSVDTDEDLKKVEKNEKRQVCKLVWLMKKIILLNF